MSILRARRVAALASVVACASISVTGCLTRPVVNMDPTTKISFTKVQKQSSVDKIDLLVVVDNSSSMADKQAYLREAVPDLVRRLVQPACISASDGSIVARDAQGACPDGSKPEFNAVHDMHIGVVSTSLGMRGGDACDPSKPGFHNDDRARLLNRAGDDEHAQAVMGTSNYLAYLPSVPENSARPSPVGASAITDPSVLVKAFQDAITGVHQNGCGIESQLEPFYRFLVQPDPYDSIDASRGSDAWVGVDATLLKQRHDFLRPDSLVVILDLTDENDSEIDVRLGAGVASNFMVKGWQPYRATSACAVDPSAATCMSCLDSRVASGDPACATRYNAPNDWGFDLGLRHAHMKEKYGFDAQYPIARYVHGLTSTRVPNRGGEYPAGRTRYVGNDTCQNPLFAAELPDGSSTDPDVLCNLKPGPRTPDMVYFAHIGGVPNQLLHVAPDDPKRGKLDETDWKRILGAAPESWDTSGIDPHMIESVKPRPGLPSPASSASADPISGRESITDADQRVDLQYACTFPLAAPRTCAPSDSTCDCANGSSRPATGVPSVCDEKNRDVQVRAKAYPTIRELEVAHKLGEQGIVASICPAHVTEAGAGDPLYGYRPAMTAIVDRLKSQLADQCLARPLEVQGGQAPCRVIEELPAATSAKSCAELPGMQELDADAQRQFDAQRLAANPGAKSSDLPLACELRQITKPGNASCSDDPAAGWCYVEKTGSCAQALRFSKAGAPVSNAKVWLQCLEAN